MAAVGITNQRETTVVWDRKHRPAALQRHRLAGHAHRRALQRAGQGRRAGPLPRADRPAAGHLLLRPEDPLAPRQRPRRASGGRTRRGALRHHRHLADLEPDRRPERRRARHRCDQRQPHAADEPADARLGRRASWLRWASRARCCRPSGRPATRLWSTADGACGERAGLRRPGRPAGRAGRPGLLRPGEAKNTYGTGCFMLLNTGTRAGAQQAAAC